MKAWRMNGSLASAVSPSEALLVGTVRQPRKVWPSDCTICSNRSSSLRRFTWIARQEHHAAAVLAGFGQGDAGPACSASSKNLCGIWIRTPAPSPVLASAPQAPR